MSQKQQGKSKGQEDVRDTRGKGTMSQNAKAKRMEETLEEKGTPSQKKQRPRDRRNTRGN